jgi:endonuclease/exonuclease/phosphatase family metal-dependent hydrolase
MKKAGRILIAALASVCGAALLLFVLAWFAAYRPHDVESMGVTCLNHAPILQPGRKIKVLSWNVQYMAGKSYVFYYDILDGSGPDERPSAKDIETTLDEVARVIKDEDPDVVLLQEVDDGAGRTDYQDQLALLLKRLPSDYACQASAFYWKALFVPHPRIMGKVGMKLSVLSKYKIRDAVRHRLPTMPDSFLVSLFSLKRAVLEVRLPVKNRSDLVVMNTHLDAFAQGTDTMERQVQRVGEILSGLTDEGAAWILGGDFNLLPPGKGYGRLDKEQKAYFKPESEIAPLFEAYRAVPGLDEVNGPDHARWYTHFSNDPRVKAPDRTIDYLFMSKKLSLGEHAVRQHDTLKISDHLPVVAVIEVP